MISKAVAITWLTVFWICCYSAQAAPVESEKGKDEFVFLLPSGAGGSNLFSGISVNLEPPTVDAFRNARDSYGNPVSPYAATEDGDKVQGTAALRFQIPSYASGITEIRKPTNELLPPIVSGEVPEDALQIPVVAQPSVELLPPLGVDNVPNRPKDFAINEVTDRIDSESVTTTETTNQDREQSKQKSEDNADEQKYDGEKYTGGFGGPPGVLGEQKEKGYFIKEKEEKEAAEKESSPNEEDKERSTEIPTESIPSSTLPPENQQPDLAQKSSESGVQFSTVINSVFSSAIPQIDTPSSETVPSMSSIGVNPTVLPTLLPDTSSPFGNIALQEISTTSPSSSDSPSLTVRFGSEKNLQQIQPPQLTFSAPPNTPSNLSPVPLFPQPSIGSGFSFSGPLFPVQPISNGPDKYMGGFGGAPGVLGNQAKPGYAVQPDGSIRDPDHTYRPPVIGIAPNPAPAPIPAPTQRPVATTVKYDKYTGGFGGPPGILAPHDKH